MIEDRRSVTDGLSREGLPEPDAVSADGTSGSERANIILDVPKEFLESGHPTLWSGSGIVIIGIIIIIIRCHGYVMGSG